MGVLTDKVVLVTGVARGCGQVLAEAFSAEGAKLVGCDTDTGGGRATAATVQAAGGEMIFVEADVADHTAVRDLVATAVQTYGGLDCAVNNAGTEATGLIADSSDDVFDELIARCRGAVPLLGRRPLCHWHDARPRRRIHRPVGQKLALEIAL
jgi:NAD(P)-dependent dehydrogenase (short-subunit alcohol dehydrogenase family)